MPLMKTVEVGGLRLSPMIGNAVAVEALGDFPLEWDQVALLRRQELEQLREIIDEALS